MKILLYAFTTMGADDMYETLSSMNHTVTRVAFPLSDYNSSPDLFIDIFRKKILESTPDVIISYSYFPLITQFASEYSIPYISWSYDSPAYTLYSKEIFDSSNYLFTFDRNQCTLLKAAGVPHVYHLPLAVNSTQLQNKLGEHSFGYNKIYPVSFVGSLYEKNEYSQISFLPDYLKGYLEALITSQHLIYDYNFLYDLLDSSVLSQLQRYIPIYSEFDIPPNIAFGDLLNAELTKRERIAYLNALSSRVPLTLFTASDSGLVPKAVPGGTLHYTEEMPYVFCTSGINLNFTLRSITSGIPLRAMDIMGAGGFLLSNYQPELAEFFHIGEECDTFCSEEELFDKVDFYLAHPQESERIARNGCLKVRNEFSYKKAFLTIFDTVGLR